jgi:hypothetical protein
MSTALLVVVLAVLGSAALIRGMHDEIANNAWSSARGCFSS